MDVIARPGSSLGASASDPPLPGADGAWDRPPWLARDAPLAVGVTAVLLAAAVGVMLALDLALGALGLSEAQIFSVAEVVLYVVIDASLVASILLVGRRRGRVTLSRLGFRGARARVALGWTLAALVLILGLGAAWSIWFPAAEIDVLEFGFGRGRLRIATVVASVVIIAPVVEEVFFRGFLYVALRRRLRPLGAAASVGVLFGLVHYAGPESVSDLPILAATGAFFCLVYERVGTLLPVIAVHAALNALFLVEDGRFALAGALAGLVVVSGCFVANRRLSLREASAPTTRPLELTTRAG